MLVTKLSKQVTNQIKQIATLTKLSSYTIEGSRLSIWSIEKFPEI
jgi:hypothetical protein